MSLCFQRTKGVKLWRDMEETEVLKNKNARFYHMLPTVSLNMQNQGGSEAFYISLALNLINGLRLSSATAKVTNFSHPSTSDPK